jgi:hypothetical protein
MNQTLRRLALTGASLTLAFAVVACAGQSSAERATQPEGEVPATPTAGQPAPGDDYETVEGRPNIDNVEVLSLDSYPPQFTVVVTSGGYNSCVSHLEDRVSIEGTTVTIEIVSREPAPGLAVPCTRIYGMHHSDVYIGTVERGVEYTVIVNGEQHGTFSW